MSPEMPPPCPLGMSPVGVPSVPQQCPHGCPLCPLAVPPLGPPCPPSLSPGVSPLSPAGMPAAGGLLCGASGLALLLAATVTDFWVTQRAPRDPDSLGLWRRCQGGLCHPHPGTPALWEATRVLMVLSVLSAAVGLTLGVSVVASSCWRVRARAAGIALLLAGLLALLALGLYTGTARSLLAPAHAAWRFSWSYILGWVAVVLTSSAGLFHLCAAAKDQSPESSEETSA
ncbi:LOW QUALITY PROTEIN: lens fiber membrane intrinsic protein-like [Phaenicophaeus curvirostris]|uniref:LOW QUALITY PROTEIN: lens fiber membrane intrinsic protein-like n=1 Tax=Phaenicophaeus curvirostris TaxID=33595 RepID=UPI0037F0DAFD